MTPLSSLCALAAVVALPAAGTGSDSPSAYDAVMRAQYAAHSAPLAQRPEEVLRVYDAYLNSIGQKAKSKSETPSGEGGDQQR